MSAGNSKCDTAVEWGSIVFLARIVDRNGAAIRRADLAAIDCSICQIEPCRPGELAVVAGHEAMPAEAGDVVFDSLQTGDLWTVDDVGYNFRHEVALGEGVVNPSARGQVEVRYGLTATSGEKTIVRFQLKVVGA